MQPDLFSNRDLKLPAASGRQEPRLWVRRLLIWEEPGKPPIRDVSLRQGLNIILSPDSGSTLGEIGHGGGKTTFCRLLRYCLGENSYGPDEQRSAIANRMPAALVGAEIRIDGETWLVRRTLGVHKEDFAILGPSFDSVQGWPSEPTGMAPFRAAATEAFLGEAAGLFPGSIAVDDRWQAFLAWLTRDQECRFAHLLDWRSPDSGSQSPLSGRSKGQGDRLAIVRAALDALGPAELETQRRHQVANDALTYWRGQVSWHDRQISLLRGRITELIGGGRKEGTELDIAALRATATTRLRRVRGASDDQLLDRLGKARDVLERAIEERQRIESEIANLTARRDDQELIAKVAGDELPELSAQNQRLRHPVCPVCGVRLDEARAQGCGISLESCDLEAMNARVAELHRMRSAAQTEVQRIDREKGTRSSRLAQSEPRLVAARAALVALERQLVERSAELRRAERSLDLVDDLETAVSDLGTAESKVEAAEKELRELSEQFEAHRLEAAGAMTQLSDRFDAVFSHLVPVHARSSVKLDGNGLSTVVPVRGAAIDSLRVAAFDLAVLAMSIEGLTRHPGFLVHDSPREADLGRTIYAALFALARELEGIGPAPLFQYVVTTTTEPPKEFLGDPWMRLQVKGSPSEARLLGVDLQ